MAPLCTAGRFVRCFSGTLGLALLLLACASSGALVQLSGLTQEPGFGGAAIASHGLAILGYEEQLPEMPDHERDQRLDYPLFAALHGAQPAATLVGAKTVRQRLQGAGLHDRVHELLRAELIRELPFATLRAILPTTRYLLSAQLQSNEVITTTAEAEEEVAYCTTRSIAVRYRIVDLVAQRAAFRVVIRRQEQDCNRNARQHTTDDVKPGGGRILGALLGDLFMNAVTDGIKGTYPGAPALAPLTDAAAHDLVSVLR